LLFVATEDIDGKQVLLGDLKEAIPFTVENWRVTSRVCVEGLRARLWNGCASSDPDYQVLQHSAVKWTWAY
jgi:hypothetical protein